MPIGWVIALTLLAFLAGWFFAGAFHVSRAEDIYREGYAKGREERGVAGAVPTAPTPQPPRAERSPFAATEPPAKT